MMPSLLQCLFLVALASLVLAAPTAERDIQKRSFKVERIPNPNFVRHVNHKRAPGAGTRALIKAYRKFGVALPQGLVDAMGQIPAANVQSELVTADGVPVSNKAKGNNNNNSGASAAAGSTGSGSGSGEVTNTPTSGDTEYLAPITVGGQTMVMDFDSGSSDLWVFNTQLSAADQTGHTIFNPTKSTTFKMLTGSTFSISYGDGSGAAGNVGTDTVNIGGATVTGQAIELATAVSSSFVQDTASNGLVGLAFSKLNTVKPAQQKTFFDNALSTLAEPVLAADLRHASAGSYEFGAIDSTKFNGTLQWAAVNTTQGFWQFTSAKFSVGTGATMVNPGNQAIADTGTTLMLANAAVVTAYYSQVQGAVNDNSVGGVTFPCNSNLPDLNVDIGGDFMATVRGDDINFSPVDATGTTCFGGLQSIAGDLQIYGDIFFKSQFVVFNLGNNSIAMAPHQS